MDLRKDEFQLREEIDLTCLCVEGERVLLHSIEEKFAPMIFKEFSEEITAYMIPKPADSIDETFAFITCAIAGMRSKNDITFVILKKEDEEFLGCCGVHGGRSCSEPELGIWIKKPAHGNGYGREAIATASEWVVRNMDVKALIYPVDRNNLRSRRIPESLGGVIIEERFEPTMRGTELDEVVYRITPESVRATA